MSVSTTGGNGNDIQLKYGAKGTVIAFW